MTQIFGVGLLSIIVLTYKAGSQVTVAPLHGTTNEPSAQI